MKRIRADCPVHVWRGHSARRLLPAPFLRKLIEQYWAGRLSSCQPGSIGLDACILPAVILLDRPGSASGCGAGAQETLVGKALKAEKVQYSQAVRARLARLLPTGWASDFPI